LKVQNRFNTKKEDFNFVLQLVAMLLATLKFMVRSGFLILSLLTLGFCAKAQNVQIELGPGEIGENQAWTTTTSRILKVCKSEAPHRVLKRAL
jgi:hypothetical protein